LTGSGYQPLSEGPRQAISGRATSNNKQAALKDMITKVQSDWTGSENTFNLVQKQIAARWGEAEAGRYNPKENCLTFKKWLANGYVVRKGEKAIKSFVMVEKKDKETGEI